MSALRKKPILTNPNYGGLLEFYKYYRNVVHNIRETKNTYKKYMEYNK